LFLDDPHARALNLDVGVEREVNLVQPKYILDSPPTKTMGHAQKMRNDVPSLGN
jgi:hypothetical protein